MVARGPSSCVEAAAPNMQGIRDRESALIFGLLRISNSQRDWLLAGRAGSRWVPETTIVTAIPAQESAESAVTVPRKRLN
jgi:hypothetical protein